jgi:hypothetical protein
VPKVVSLKFSSAAPKIATSGMFIDRQYRLHIDYVVHLVITE